MPWKSVRRCERKCPPKLGKSQGDQSMNNQQLMLGVCLCVKITVDFYLLNSVGSGRILVANSAIICESPILQFATYINETTATAALRPKLAIKKY